MNTASSDPAPLLRDQRGVVLPLVMIMSLLLSVLLMSAYLTAATETTQSGAHQESVRALHNADGALQWFIATKAEAMEAKTDSFFPQTVIRVPPGGDSTRFTVARLRRVGGVRTFSILVEPVRHPGRTVSGMVDVYPPTLPFKFDVRAALTATGEVGTDGSPVIHGRQTQTSRCANQTQVNAVQVSAAGKFDGSTSNFVGSVQRTSETKLKMQNRYLTDMTPRQMAQFAEIKFGRMFRQPRFHKDSLVSSTRPRNSRYNWGCPATMVTCNLANANVDTTYYPIIAVDMDDADDEDFLKRGGHGQGILIILNKRVKVEEDAIFNFRGIIVSERGMEFERLRVDGAVFATNPQSKDDDDDKSKFKSSTRIVYDPCVINRVQTRFNEVAIASGNSGAQVSPVFAWTEFVR